MKPIPSPHGHMYPTNGEKIVKGMDMARMVHKWVEANEEAFWAIYDFLKKLQRQQVAGRVRDRVAVYCNQNHIEVGMDAFSFGNAYWAGISRYMVLHDPSLEFAPIEFADSYIDYYGLLPVSYLPELGAKK